MVIELTENWNELKFSIENKKLKEHIKKYAGFLQQNKMCNYYESKYGHNFLRDKKLLFNANSMDVGGLEINGHKITVIDYHYNTEKGIENAKTDLIKFDNYIKYNGEPCSNGLFIMVFFIENNENKEQARTKITYALNQAYTSANFRVDVYHKSEEIYTGLEL